MRHSMTFYNSPLKKDRRPSILCSTGWKTRGTSDLNALHQGVIAITAAQQYAALDDILQLPAQKGQAPLYLVLDGVEDPRNLRSERSSPGRNRYHGGTAVCGTR